MLFRVILNCKLIIIIKKRYNISAIILGCKYQYKLFKIFKNEY